MYGLSVETELKLEDGAVQARRDSKWKDVRFLGLLFAATTLFVAGIIGFSKACSPAEGPFIPCDNWGVPQNWQQIGSANVELDGVGNITISQYNDLDEDKRNLSSAAEQVVVAVRSAQGGGLYFQRTSNTGEVGLTFTNHHALVCHAVLALSEPIYTGDRFPLDTPLTVALYRIE